VRRAAGIAALAAAALALLLQRPAAAATTCPTIDATAALSQIADSTAGQPPAAQIAAFRRGIIEVWPDLYRPEVIGIDDPALVDGQILKSLEAARREGERTELKQLLRAHIAAATTAFGVFKDFSCNFPIYFADMLGALDGAGRVIAGQPAMVLGLDALERERTKISLAVFFTHEFFHRYHFQAAGFSDDLEDRQEIWRNLWAEGLATYVSEVLTRGATQQQALMLPSDLAQRGAPLLGRMASELLAGFDSMDKPLFQTYFTYGSAAGRGGIPPRAGYYVGYRVARELAHHYSLNQLAHLKGDALHRQIVATLRKWADAAVPAAP
jgi:hypothetical protein